MLYVASKMMLTNLKKSFPCFDILFPQEFSKVEFVINRNTKFKFKKDIQQLYR